MERHCRFSDAKAVYNIRDTGYMALVFQQATKYELDLSLKAIFNVMVF